MCININMFKRVGAASSYANDRSNVIKDEILLSLIPDHVSSNMQLVLPLMALLMIYARLRK